MSARDTHAQASSRPPRRGPMGHGPRAMMPGEKAADFKGTMKKLLAFMGAFKVSLVVLLVFAVASTVFTIVGPKVLSTATTELFEGIAAKVAGTGGIDFGAVGTILATTLALYCISAACSFVQGWQMTHISQKTCYILRQRIAEKIDRLPMGYFERTSTGDVLSRITNDVDTLGQSLNQGVTQLVTSAVTIVGVVAMMLSINAPMTLIVLLIVPVSLVLVRVVVSHSQKHFRAQQKNLGAINGQVEETFSGHAVVHAFGREEQMLEKFRATNEKLYESAWKSQFLSGLMMPAMNLVGNLGYVAVAVSGAALAIQGAITVGDIQAFIQYVKNFTQPITQLAQVSNVLQQMAAAAERVFEFLDADEEDAVPAADAVASKQACDAASGTSHFGVDAGSSALARSGAESGESPMSVEFDHVRFGYDPDSPVIKDFSAKVAPGQTVALVGPTGAGKTTMVKLLMRFYDVDGGAIRIGGRDIRDMSRDEVRAQFAMVLQDTFISTLPGGYDMEINEDASNISQGQRQLLTIARAVLADRRMLILDEATSSVDTRTEERIQMAMDNLMRGRTSFVIAHRLSTIRNADLILVLNHGDIVEQGTHAQLLELGGAYAELYNSQFADAGATDCAER